MFSLNAFCLRDVPFSKLPRRCFHGAHSSCHTTAWRGSWTFVLVAKYQMDPADALDLCLHLFCDQLWPLLRLAAHETRLVHDDEQLLPTEDNRFGFCR